MSADASTLKKSNGTPQLRRIGVNRASTFLGFCKNHDNALFDQIDNYPLNSNKEQVALYAYRCICREYFVKENAVNVIDGMFHHVELSSEQREFLRLIRIGHSRGFAGLQHHKKIYDATLQAKDYDSFEFTYFISKSPCSLQLSGLLYPDFDFLGERLQDLGDWSSPLDLITFFTAPLQEGWAFGFAWHTSSNRTCIPFVQSLATLVSDNGCLEDALLRLSLSCCENHAIRISWWDSLAAEHQIGALKRMHLMTHPTLTVPNRYLVSGCEKMANWTFEHLYTTLPSTAA
ncbi:hypothetical protein [uncultured Lamprocystis sp.]|uniref:hypothetical protein n=1 Tax=uncultured Lamprocystis sp. TaxID=543132 RepID=UPI0025D6DB73|nr:hypothetical protein [uncultured Lamprocystis sp.]